MCCCHPQSEEPPHTIKEGKAGVHSWRAWAWIVSSAYSRWWVLHVCFSCWETSIAFRWHGNSPDFAISLPLSLFFVFYFMAFPGYSCLSAYELCQRSYSSVCVLQCKSLTWKALFSFFLHELCSHFLFTIRKYQSSLKPVLTAIILLLTCSTIVSFLN